MAARRGQGIQEKRGIEKRGIEKRGIDKTGLVLLTENRILQAREDNTRDVCPWKD